MKLRVFANKFILLLVSICVIALAFTNFPSVKSENAKSINVDKTGFADFTSIQDAIDSANEGDIIHVAPGTYFENIVINKTITIIGSDKDKTIIDGRGIGNVIWLAPSSNWVNITGFTIQNSGFEEYRSGIDIDSDNNMIYENIIKNCKYGIKLELWGHNCRVVSNTISENIYGVLVYSVTPNDNIIARNNFIGNNFNAYDDSNSSWSYIKDGNYWDDYKGQDNNGDGIGDTPYQIPGGSAQDAYPKIKPFQTPGFEMLTVIVAVALAFIILRKKRQISK